MMNLMSLTSEFAEFLKAELERRGWSGRMLALYSEVSQSTVARAVRGESVPEPENVRKLANTLELDEAFVLRKAGYIAAPPTAMLDEAALHIAQRITQQPSDLRANTLQAVRALLDSLESTYGLAGGGVAPKSVQEIEDMAVALDETDVEFFDVVEEYDLETAEGRRLLNEALLRLKEVNYERYSWLVKSLAAERARRLGLLPPSQSPTGRAASPALQTPEQERLGG